LDFTFRGTVLYWRGPAPHFFVPIPDDLGREIKAQERNFTYGWGCIPATVWLGDTEWTTSLFPKNGTYWVPVKLVVRKQHQIEEGSEVELRVQL
jgi:hypothetical protein